MFSVKIIDDYTNTEQTFNLFYKLHFDQWKYKDDWLKIIDEEYNIPHNKVQLINNETNEVVLEKELKKPSKYNTKYPLQYFKNIIYDTVRKSIGMKLYKKDKYDLTYVIIPYSEDNDPSINYKDAKLFYGYCESPYITGELCESEEKAYTNVKKVTYERLLNLGIKVSQTYIQDIIISEASKQYSCINYGY